MCYVPAVAAAAMIVTPTTANNAATCWIPELTMLPALTRLLASDDSLLSRAWRRLQGSPPGSLCTVPLTTYAAYVEFHRTLVPEYRRREQLEWNLIGAGDSFLSEGWCHVCNHAATFETNFDYAPGQIRNGKRVPNWREHVICTRCGLNNRLRASVHFLERNLGCTPAAHIYMTEQSTPLYQHMKLHYPKLIGSEFFGDRIAKLFHAPSHGVLIVIRVYRVFRCLFDVRRCRPIRKALAEIHRSILHRLAAHLADDRFSKRRGFRRDPILGRLCN